MLDFQKLSATYQQALLRQVVPFWLKNSRDEQCGGYFDLLSATGEVIEGDKFVSLQAQQVWAFSWLYNSLDGQPAWLNHAVHGAAFLNQFAHSDTLACYAQLDRRGRPVAAATDFVPDCSAVMAYSQLHRATSNDDWAMLAKQTFSALLQRRESVRHQQREQIGGVRPICHLGETAALLKTVLEMQPFIDEETWKQNVDSVLQEILHEFVDRRTDTLREYVLPEGAFMNTPEGRRLNVGLTFQTAGYLLDFYGEQIAHKTGPATTNYRKLATQATEWCLQMCEQGWDETAGGLNQFVDFKQQPQLFPDWQQKWAWVQVEALAALLKCYFYTRHPDCLKWFKRIHDNTFHHFPDPKQPGWHVAIDQYNQPLIKAKALPSVGPYSLIRCLTETIQFLPKCGQLQTKETNRPLKSTLG